MRCARGIDVIDRTRLARVEARPMKMKRKGEASSRRRIVTHVLNEAIDEYVTLRKAWLRAGPPRGGRRLRDRRQVLSTTKTWSGENSNVGLEQVYIEEGLPNVRRIYSAGRPRETCSEGTQCLNDCDVETIC